ncbi:MAG: triose-phosphate isomerase [Planctomycetes bacterium]|nr:triose-phosphate isomerase [Planctomycetota bacterium]MBI3844889.1 triose-phosphate isomerase [Planctomycetota bacterium]
MSTARRALVAGNWKMYKDRAAAKATALALRETLGSCEIPEVAVFPPFPFLADVSEALHGSAISLGAQDLHPGKEGAFTGEVSGWMLRSVGCRWVIVGHSERRHQLGETDEVVARKLRAALESGLDPILCVGETLQERERRDTERVIERQIESAFHGVGTSRGQVTIAYEPVWAIGTGRNATPEQASEVHKRIRDWSEDARVRVLYGGSVKPENVGALAKAPEIDGVLVGGASLEVSSFARLVAAFKSRD